MARSKEIDKLRAIAILMVMCVHFPTLKYKLHLDPWSGVDLFFVISGFVVPSAFLQKLDILLLQSQARSIDIINYIKCFFIRRIMRLYPVMLTLLFLYLIGYISLKNYGFPGNGELWKEFLSIIFYFNNFYVSYGGSALMAYHWSLSVEEHFYIVFPIICVLISRNTSRIIFCIFVISIITFLFRPYCFELFNRPREIIYLTQYRLDGIFYGFLLFLLVYNYNTINNKLIILIYRIKPICVILSFFLITIILISPKLISSPNYNLPMISISSLILIYFAQTNNNIILPIKLLNPIFNWIGIRSYILYLLHIPTVRFMQSLTILVQKKQGTHIPYFIYLPITVFLLFLLTEVIHKFIEIPCISKAKIITSKIEQKYKNKLALTQVDILN